MIKREILTVVVIVGAMLLAGLGKISADVLVALIGGAMMPSPVVRDYSAE